MRTRTLHALTVAALVVTTGALVSFSQVSKAQTADTHNDAGNPSASCDPKWSIVTTPTQDRQHEDTGSFNASIAAVSPDNVWFPGASWPFAPSVSLPHDEALRWNGHSIVRAPSLAWPADAWSGTNNAFGTDVGASGTSFDSADDGWMTVTDHDEFSDGSEIHYAMAHWDGTRWSAVPAAPSPDPQNSQSDLQAVAALSPSNAWAVGTLEGVGEVGASGALIQHWDGRSWSNVPNPASAALGSSLAAITAVSPADIWAVGVTRDGAGNDVPLAEHFDGNSWRTVPMPTGAEPAGSVWYGLAGVHASGPDDVWAVSSFEVGHAATPLIEHYDGSTWSVVAGLPTTSGNVVPTDVYAANPTDVWVTVSTASPHTGRAALWHFDGSSWTEVPWPGGTYGLMFSWASHIAGFGPDDIWAVGGDQDLLGQTGTYTRLRIIHLSCDGSAR